MAFLAQKSLRTDPDFVEDEVPGANGAEPELVLVWMHRQPGSVLRDDERSDAPMTQRSVHGRERDEELGDVEVRDPGLGAADDELVVLPLVRRLHPGDVGT